MDEVENALQEFTALCLRSIWPPEIMKLASRLRCSLQSYAYHRGHPVIWRMLKEDFTEFERTLTAHHPSA